jgi:hypothetical protein
MERNSHYEIKKPIFFSNGRKKYLFIVVLFTMPYSCKKPGQLNNYHPDLAGAVKARGHIVEKSGKFPPRVFPVGVVKKRPAGKPKITHIISHERLAGIPVVSQFEFVKSFL